MQSDLPQLAHLNLPVLRHDETLYSWCGFVHAWNGNSRALDTSRLLFGVPYAALLHDFPSHLTALTCRTAEHLGTAIDIALRHTVLGYYLPLISKTRADQILAAVQAGSISHLKMSLGIPASRVGAGHPLKTCFECVNEDRGRYGSPFWHVHHQYPSSIVCTRHHSPLAAVHVTPTPVHHRNWLLPGQQDDRARPKTTVTNTVHIGRLAKLAEFSEFFAQIPPGALDPPVLSETYRIALTTQGFVTANGSLRTPILVRWIRDHYAGLEDLPGLAVLTAIRSDWPGLLALSRKTPRRGHPLKHLLLISALFDSWIGFKQAYTLARTNICTSEDFAAPRSEAEPNARHQAFVTLVNDGLSVTAAAKKLGVTSTTGVRWAKVLCLSFTSRAKSLHPSVLNAARELLAAGHPKMVVCEKTMISSVSLNRLISSEPAVAEAWRKARFEVLRRQNRDRFLDVVRMHSGWSINDIRRLPENGYAWLYRHDREWLAAHLPAIWQVGKHVD